MAITEVGNRSERCFDLALRVGKAQAWAALHAADLGRAGLLLGAAGHLHAAAEQGVVGAWAWLAASNVCEEAARECEGEIKQALEGAAGLARLMAHLLLVPPEDAGEALKLRRAAAKAARDLEAKGAHIAKVCADDFYNLSAPFTLLGRSNNED